jgi:hypothetical protein
MGAIKTNIIIDQGADYSTTINLSNDSNNLIILTGYSGNAEMRKAYSSCNVAAIFTVNVSQDIIGSNVGAISISLNAASTANINGGRYYYDVYLISNTGISSRILQGIATVTPSVTHSSIPADDSNNDIGL